MMNRRSTIGTVTILVAVAMTLRAAGQDASGHDANPVFRALVERGVTLTDGQVYPLPAPVFPDGVTAEQQSAILTKLLDGLPLDRFLRDSVVAPHIFRLEEPYRDEKVTVRKMDIYFVIHTPLEAVRSEELVNLLGDGESTATARELSAEELSTRRITVPAESPNAPRRESYAQAKFSLLDRAELQLTVRSSWSETRESMIGATMVDPQFESYPELASRWRPLIRQDDGSQKVGTPQPYRGAGGYIKVTRLAAPQDAIFVESHFLYAEPFGWFDGTNALRAKLPAIVQNQVRAARREIIKATQ